MRVSRPLPLLLLAAAAASASPQHSASSALSSANHLEARTLGWLWNWATGASRHKCPATFVCDGSGTDGYEYDVWGNGRPSWTSPGWLYFGQAVGWAPSKNWQCSKDWRMPSQFVKTCGKVRWFSPVKDWKGFVDVDVDISLPSWWIIWPSKTWVSAGLGLDGKVYDWQGKTCDHSKYPVGWLWFGSSLGWGPPKGFVPAASWIPSVDASASLGVATWWTPPSTWIIPAHLTIPLHWRPSSSWSCNGQGLDGWRWDHNGNGRPSWTSSGWLWFGASVGWAPTADWKCDKDWTLPPQFVKTCDRVKWWSPVKDWKGLVGTDLDISLPSWWIIWPSKTWVSAGLGLDGKVYDWQGKTCDHSKYPVGWLWFGSSLGWGPPKGFVPAASWIPSIDASASLGVATWWTPPSTWIIPAHLTIPLHWRPSLSWTCNGKGLDGWRWDHNGNGRPTWAPAGWLWFGSSIGWAPTAGWTCGTSWTMPAEFGKTCVKVHWFSPPASWVPPLWIPTIPSWWPHHTISTTSVEPATQTTSRMVTTTKKATITAKASASCTTASLSTTHKVTSTRKATTTSKASTTKKATTTHEATTTHKVTTTHSTTSKAAVTTSAAATPSPKPCSSCSRPSSDWKCDGSGKDGHVIDHKGQGCPSYLPAGWLWFGVEIGWSAPHGWQIPSQEWHPTDKQLEACAFATWWAAPLSWHVPAGVQVPAHWRNHGWRIPSVSWQCSGDGNDGYDFDYYGRSRPVGFEFGIKFFGSLRGWQPCKTFIQPAQFSPPSGWNAAHATWWYPRGVFYVPKGLKCQRWWKKQHLRGHISWA